MAKKQKSDGQNDKDQNEGKNKKKEEEEKTTPTTVVLKVDMHCDGCASRIVKCIHGFEGVETVKAEKEAGKLTITGNVDPTKLRDKLANKMKKKVDLISPLPNKDKENKPQNQNKNKPDDNKPPKEPPVTTAVLKVELHCQGCIERIRKTVLKTRGVYNLAIDREKDTVTVKGTMEVKALVENLTKRLKRKVEVVPPNKEKDKENEKEGAAGDNGENGGGKKKKQNGGGGENKKAEDGGGGDGKGKTDQQSKMEVMASVNGYGYGYGDGYYVHAPQIFSDENPNACSVM